MRFDHALGFVLIGFGAVVLGCGDGGVAPTVKASGKITYKGSPLANVNVTFEPQSGRPATGTTDSSGNYTLSTFTTNDGAVPGKHKVYLSTAQSAPPPMPGTPEADAYQPPPLPFPIKYAISETSPLTADVEAGKKSYDFDLTD